MRCWCGTVHLTNAMPSRRQELRYPGLQNTSSDQLDVMPHLLRVQAKDISYPLIVKSGCPMHRICSCKACLFHLLSFLNAGA